MLPLATHTHACCCCPHYTTCPPPLPTRQPHPPVTQLSTPAGRPAAAKHCTIIRPATAPWVGGLSTTVLPAISAGAILLQGRGGTTGQQKQQWLRRRQQRRRRRQQRRRQQRRQQRRRQQQQVHRQQQQQQHHHHHHQAGASAVLSAAAVHPPDCQVDRIVEGGDAQHHAQGHLRPRQGEGNTARGRRLGACATACRACRPNAAQSLLLCWLHAARCTSPLQGAQRGPCCASRQTSCATRRRGKGREERISGGRARTLGEGHSTGSEGKQGGANEQTTD